MFLRITINTFLDKRTERVSSNSSFSFFQDEKHEYLNISVADAVRFMTIRLPKPQRLLPSVRNYIRVNVQQGKKIAVREKKKEQRKKKSNVKNLYLCDFSTLLFISQNRIWPYPKLLCLKCIFRKSAQSWRISSSADLSVLRQAIWLLFTQNKIQHKI